MNVLIVFAHPERRSLNGALLRASIDRLEKEGHAVEVSDLYAQKWKAVLDREDYHYAAEQRLRVLAASRERYQDGTIPADILAEQEKLQRADAVIFQYPMWWFGMPAILRGWFERVYSHAFGYGRGEHSTTRWGDRYGEGLMQGKRAMLSVTMGGRRDHYAHRAINGPIEDLLYPVNHGLLFYIGFEVLPSFLLYDADKLTEERYEKELLVLNERLTNLFSDEPIPYRSQNGGDYHIPSLWLREGLEQGNESTPFALHKRSES